MTTLLIIVAVAAILITWFAFGRKSDTGATGGLGMNESEEGVSGSDREEGSETLMAEIGFTTAPELGAPDKPNTIQVTGESGAGRVALRDRRSSLGTGSSPVTDSSVRTTLGTAVTSTDRERL